MYVFNFEKLVVWQKSRQLVKLVYVIASRLPREERYGLSDQLRRAVISVSSNIAEGAGRVFPKEKLHFCEIAYGSLMEVICQLTLAADLGLIEEEELAESRDLIEEISRMLSAYRKALNV